MTEPEPRDQSRWAERLATRRERYRDRGKLYRLVFVIVGITVTLAGVAMLLLPGPAFVVIPIGLAMLAMEFAWAESALEKALVQAEKAQSAAKEADTKQKVLTAVAIALVAAAAVGAVFYWDIAVPVLNPAD